MDHYMIPGSLLGTDGTLELESNSNVGSEYAGDIDGNCDFHVSGGYKQSL